MNLKPLSKESFVDSLYLPLQDQEFLQSQRIAGKVAAKALIMLEQMVIDKTDKSLIELDIIVEQFIRDNGGIPSFKGYRGFPNSCCFSINKQLVHGLATDYRFQEGDMITFDLGVTYNHTIGDSALSVIFGEPKCEQHVRLLNTTKKALYAGINAVKVGNRMGCIGNAIYKCAASEGFGVVNNYGGHTIIRDNDGNEVLHAQPFIANRDNVNNGIRIQPGMVLCIEPMLTIGEPKTTTKEDRWTVETEGLSCHYEETIYIHSDHIEIITDKGNL